MKPARPAAPRQPRAAAKRGGAQREGLARPGPQRPPQAPAKTGKAPASAVKPAAQPGRQAPGAPRAPAGARPPPGRPAPPAAVEPLSAQELDALQALIDCLPAQYDALDVEMVDGYLCGVLLQPVPVPENQWLPRVVDLDGRPPPPGFAMDRLRALLRRRHAELDQAIAERDWFDPWVYAPDEDADEATAGEEGAGDDHDPGHGLADPSAAVLPWVAGFAAAVDTFTVLMDRHEDALLEPLALLYRHLDPDDLEDAEALLAEIETYEPPASLDEAVEELVRSVLLIADVSRPVDAPTARSGGRPPAKKGPPRGGPRPPFRPR